ncbi:phosphonate ABC transporter, permease protein PhnE [Labrys sp. 22185]|uniref:phosphonate ABC transporter, permease protein PhnE n=1 Tax=Labrys sp. 22185 TaxID=3453888 RepID=UPI003F86B0C1
MLPAINSLPEAQAQALLKAYQATIAAKKRRIWLAVAVGIALYALSAHVASVRPGFLWTHLGNFTSFFSRIAPPLSLGNFLSDIREWYWGFGKWLVLLGDTLLVAYLGTLLGVLGAFVLCFMAAANLTRSRLLRAVVRRWLEFCRTVPTIVFAMIFLIAFKSGPMAGALALAIHTMGALGKLFAEVVENADMKPVEGTVATGGSWLESIRFAVLPQTLPNFASYSLLRFEINVREAGVMGFIGVGGIGQELLVAIRTFAYADVSAILLMIIVTVFIIDFATEKLRHRLIGQEALH